jgi:type III secretory pathway component EscV
MGNIISFRATDDVAVLKTFVCEVRKHIIMHQSKSCEAFDSNSLYCAWVHESSSTQPNQSTVSHAVFDPRKVKQIIHQVLRILKNMQPEQLQSWCVSSFDVLHYISVIDFTKHIGLTWDEMDDLFAVVSWKDNRQEYAMEYYRKEWQYKRDL